MPVKFRVNMVLSLLPTDDTPPTPPNAQSATLTAFITYNLPIVEDLVRFYHAVSGFSVKSTWLQDVKAGNYATLPGLSTTNDTNYFPDSVGNSKGHMTQTIQGLCSTNLKYYPVPVPDPTTAESLPQVAPNKLNIQIAHVRSVYTDDMGRFPVFSCSGN